MLSKERVMMSLNWQEPDRVPIQIYNTPEVHTKLVDHFKGRDYLEALGVDFRGLGPVYKGEKRPSENGIQYDMWGAGYKRVTHGTAGTYNEAVHLPLAELKTMDDVDKYPWPDPDHFDYSGIADACERFKGYAVVFGGAGMPDIVNGVSRGRGMEQVMIDIALDDEVGMAIIDKRVNIFYEVMKRSLQAADGKIDILHVGEDTGTQKGRLVSPRVFDRIFRPRLKRYYDLAHEFGAKVMMHACGDNSDLMETFIDMGLDILDSMQPEPPGMDLDIIRTRCKGRMAFCGLISTQSTLPHGTVEECRAEARHRIDVLAKGGGYIFAPSHNIQPDTPLENILAVYEEALGEKLE